MKSRMFLFILSLSAPVAAHADISTDKTVGQCVSYLLVTSKPKAAEQALGFADNESRALKFGKTWMHELKQVKSDKSATQVLLVRANGSCREIGMRPGDYKD